MLVELNIARFENFFIPLKKQAVEAKLLKSDPSSGGRLRWALGRPPLQVLTYAAGQSEREDMLRAA